MGEGVCVCWTLCLHATGHLFCLAVWRVFFLFWVLFYATRTSIDPIPLIDLFCFIATRLLRWKFNSGLKRRTNSLLLRTRQHVLHQRMYVYLWSSVSCLPYGWCDNRLKGCGVWYKCSCSHLVSYSSPVPVSSSSEDPNYRQFIVNTQLLVIDREGKDEGSS